jgi:hypothetical protein
MKHVFRILIVCFSCALLFSCGYSFAPRGESIDNRIQKIYVKSFGNNTSQAELDYYLRKALIDQFLQNSRFQIVNSMESADAVVEGDVVNFYTTSLARGQNNLAAEERATMVINVSFREIASGKTLWSGRQMTGTVDYSLSEDINFLPAARAQALMKLAGDMAEKAFNLMMSGF